MARVTLFFGTVHQRQPGIASSQWHPNLEAKRAANGIGGERMFLFLMRAGTGHTDAQFQ
jgi:hypothetical protein